MKKALYLLPVSMIMACASVQAQQAQKANIDSLELVVQISQDQLKLGKLQNMIDQRNTNKENAVVDAQNSASDNVRAAERLDADPNNKKLARDANNKAGDAKSDAGKSRKQSRRLDDLNKEIMDLKTKIALAQAKLSIYYPTPQPTPLTMPAPQNDSTQHP